MKKPVIPAADLEPSLRKHEREAWLREHFADAVPALGFSALAVALDDKQVIHPERFRFVPVTPKSPADESSFLTGYGTKVPAGVRCTYIHNNYKENKGLPFMDTQFGIGLVYSDWLVALAAAQVEPHGPLRIMQLQDVTGINSATTANKRLRFRSGLYNNFAWRDTLVGAWDAIAAQAQAPHLQVLGAINNRHYEKHGARLVKGYDDVASRMSFTRMPDNNWTRPVAANEQQ